MQPSLQQALSRALGAPLREVQAVTGGDINAAWRALAGARPVFIKAQPGGGDDWFRVEAKGLDWLREAEALPVPEVLALSEPGAPVAWMALEHVEAGPLTQAADEAFGRGLAALHRAGAPRFGLAYDNLIGRLPQENGPLESWAAFWTRRRLLPQADAAAPKLPTKVRRRVDKVIARVHELVGPEEPPARLHGDLWGGNRLVGSDGRSWLIDPAVYGGHREVDLAMMRLFGGFSQECLAAYAEAFPLAEGHARRAHLYQLYYLLVHVNLFGGGWAGAVDAAARALL